MSYRFVRSSSIILPFHKALIFDMDGVLIDSAPLHLETEQATCRLFGVHVPASYWRECRGRMAREIFRAALARFSHSGADLERMIRHKTELFLELAPNKLKTVPGALFFVPHVRRLFEHLAVTTSSNRFIQATLFERLGLTHYFDTITTADDVHSVKPDPEGYRYTVLKLGLQPSECLVIEDADIGVRAARTAGCSVIGITTEWSAAELYRAGAHHVVHSFEELSSMLMPSRSILSPFTTLSGNANSLPCRTLPFR